MRPHVLRHEEERVYVGVERGEPLLLGQVGNVPVNRVLEGVVQREDVDAAQRLQRPVHGLFAIAHVPQVCAEEEALLAVTFDFLLRLLRVGILLRQVHDEAVGALHGVEHGDGSPYPRVGTCD